ncbi:MAG TPA: Spy/CpxP family protein refolding chaperone [Azospirillaceae bacterium]|nr:Spy/CpxP family protein refolding chaperone [Azospirillaceae bacterium]
MNVKRILIATAALGTIAVAAIPVVAQSGGPGGHHGMMGAHWGGPARMQMMCENVDARVAGALAFAETKLNLTDAQKPGWTKLADTVKGSTQPLKQACGSVDFNNPPQALPDRMARMEAFVTAGANMMQTVRPVVADFYNTLTPEQKQVADQLMQHRGGPRGRQ